MGTEMKREDIEKLVGGYATNTLTPEERRALYEAALGDQLLFDALAREDALRELLEDPRSRRQVENALRPEPQSWWAWVRQPRVWGLAGAVAATAVLAVVVIRMDKASSRGGEFQTAKNMAPAAAAPSPVPAPAPAKVPAEAPATQPRPGKKAAAREPIPGMYDAPRASVMSREKEMPSAPAALAVDKGVVADTVLSAPPLQEGKALGAAPAVAPPPPPPPRIVSQMVAADASQVGNETMAPQKTESRMAKLSDKAESQPVFVAEKPATTAPKLTLQYNLLVGNEDDLRVSLVANQDGFLMVSGEHGKLFAGKVKGGRAVTVKPAAADNKITAVLTRAISAAPMRFGARMSTGGGVQGAVPGVPARQDAEGTIGPGGEKPVVVEIDLRRKKP